MHTGRLLIFLVITIGTIISACQQQEPLPTRIPLDISPDNTTTVGDTETPDMEPSIEDNTTEELPTATPRTRPTLPPTWTPVPIEQPTDTPTAIPPTFTPFAPANATLPPACNNFRVDVTNTDQRFELGRAPSIAWTSVDGAASYRIVIGDSRGQTIRDDIYIVETSYTFDASLFIRGEVYGWVVYPLDTRGIQMCFPVGLDLIPFVPLGG